MVYCEIGPDKDETGFYLLRQVLSKFILSGIFISFEGVLSSHGVFEGLNF